MNRIQLMRERLEKAFAPTHLEIVDDSAKHKGHAGAAGGAGHYTVIIAASRLQNLSRVEAHREIYGVFQDLIPDQIHALKIQIIKSQSVE